jgi:hypothetical protein
MGGTMVLVTLLGALAYLKPQKKVFILAEPFSIRIQALELQLIYRSCAVMLAVLFGLMELLGGMDLGLEGILPREIELVFLMLAPLSLAQVAVLWLALRAAHVIVLIYAQGDWVQPIMYAPAFALVAGTCYALVERWWHGNFTRGPLPRSRVPS